MGFRKGMRVRDRSFAEKSSAFPCVGERLDAPETFQTGGFLWDLRKATWVFLESGDTTVAKCHL